ncbi:penicillin-binding protein 4 [Enterococcus florum]|uniref:Penicillin-binding protein 4 n=1 Tax=Enterococcus florum TaxID=2480627 RepID=A0A4P5PTS8_9ENTE|nr:penicillin-binding transpeptidase domain-containing protein [Enterococcus florum]GCF95873.1 penicillin-binding protein 4 [Enterococcus florum]
MERSTKRKSSSKKTWVTAVVLVLLVISAFVGYRFYQAQQMKARGEKTIQGFTKALSDGEYPQLTQYLETDSIKESGYTEKAVQEKYQSIFSGISASNIKVKNVEINGDQFRYALSMNTGLGSLKDQTYQGSFSEDNQKINWKPDLIFPEMADNDKVSYQPNPAERGEILDRNEQGLAVNGTVYQLGVVPKELGEGAEKEKRIAAIAEAIDSSVDSVNKMLDQAWVQPDLFVPLGTVSEQPEGTPEGLEVRQATGRTYPLGEAAAQLIGYVGKVTAEDIEKNEQLSSESLIGRTGLERALDKELRGKDGGVLAITDKNGQQKNVLQEVKQENGKTIKLTIDSKAQQIAYDSLDDQSGSSVVMAPKTGELMTLVSSPSFDPNKMTNGISQAEYDTYNNDTKLPFLSRFATGYAPGSTFKTVTAAIGLDSGSLDPNQQVTIDGLKWQKDSSWGGYQVTRVSEVSPVDLKTALVYSDNIYMAQETLRMGEDTFRSGLDKFIFGEKLDLPIAMDPAQISNKDSFNSEVLLADTGYGQGQLLLNPIQQIASYSVFPNNGTLVYPKLIAAEETKTKKEVIKSQTASLITQDMQAVVSDPNGTANSLASLGISLAAKTGTAEIKENQDERGKQNSFLYAFDAQNQRYSVLEFLEDREDNQSATDLSRELLTYLDETY